MASHVAHCPYVRSSPATSDDEVERDLALLLEAFRRPFLSIDLDQYGVVAVRIRPTRAGAASPTSGLGDGAAPSPGMTGGRAESSPVMG